MSGETEQQTAVVEQVEATPEAQPVVIRKQPKALSQRDPVKIAEHFWKSGFFPDVKSMSQAVVKIIAGEELGLPPMAAMQGLTMIEGKLGMTGNLVATKVKQHDQYDYKVVEKTNERCTLQFCIDDEPIDDEEEGKVTFTVEDARQAGLVKPKSNWEKYPRAMCFNRALTEGVRTYMPDVTAGTPIYSTEEIEEVISEAPAAEGAEQAGAASGLASERVEHLAKGIDLATPSLEQKGCNRLDGLNVLLGSLGIDGFDPLTPLREELAKLTDEQADALDAELQNLGDTDGQDGGESDAG